MRHRRLHVLPLLILAACLPRPVLAQTFLSENFNAGIPVTWSIVNGGNTSHTWEPSNGGYGGLYLDGSEFAFVNSDGAGNLPPVYMHEELTSPVVSIGAATTVYLEFDHYFRGLGQTDSGHVEVYNGTTWLRLASYRNTTGAWGNPAHVQLDLSPHLNPGLRIRFTYDDNTLWAWYWAVDNVRIYAPLNLDASVTGLVAPLLDGRALTQRALGSATPISVTLRNLGTDTIQSLPLHFQVDALPFITPETLSTPLPPNATTTFTFSTTADLSAVGPHAITVAAALPTDADRLNDTLRFRRTQHPNAPLLFPHCQSFEAVSDTALQQETVGLQGAPELDFTTSQPGFGRVRTFGGAGFPRTGIRALTFDRNPTGSPDAINFAIFTYNLSGLNPATDLVLLDLALMEHGDEIQLRDSIWIRGCDTCTWRRIIGWNTLTGGVNGFWFYVNGFNVSAALVAAGQGFSSSFQVRVGQEDNFNTTTTGGNDGLTIDDLCLRRIFQQDALPTAIVLPIDEACGDSLAQLAISLRNGGTDTLDSIPVTLTVTGATAASYTGTLPGPLLPGATDTLLLGNLNTFSGGSYHFQLQTSLSADQYPANDTLLLSLDILGLPPAPSVAPDTVCPGDTARLSILNPDPQQRYDWYSAPSGGTLLYSGTSFAQGPIFAPTPFFVEARHIRHGRLGPPNNSIGNGTASGAFAEGPVFDALLPFRLDSLSFYPADTGYLHLNLFDSSGALIRIDSFRVEPPLPFARTTIAPAWDIPVGIAHRITASGTTFPTMWRNSTGANYPYTHSNVAAITGTTNDLPTYYYFFYDWRISYPDCPGPRSTILVDTSALSPFAAFNLQAQHLDISLQNASLAATSYHWDFGDGNSSTQASPTHTYATGGTYTICLIATNACGTDTFCTTHTATCAPLAPGFTATANQLSVIFTDTTAGAVSAQWDFGDGSPAQAGGSLVHTFPSDSTYLVCLSVANVCQDSATTCDSIQVCANLNCSFVASPGPGGLSVAFQPLFTGQPVAYSWQFGTSGSSSLAAPMHTFPQGGPYTVTLTIYNRCGDSATFSSTLILTGREEPIPMWRAWPNPTDGLLHIDTGIPATAIRLMDALGRRVDVPIQARTGTRTFVDMGSLPSGVYLLEMEWGEERASTRVMLRR